MNPEAVLQKTEKGLQEIETRKFKLSGRLRAVLIMIDGQRTAGELLEQAGSLADQLEGQLNELLSQGFVADLTPVPEPEAEPTIEPVQVPAPRPVPEAARPAPAAPAPRPAAAPAPAPATPPAATPVAPKAEAVVRTAVPLDVLKTRFSKMVSDTLGMRAVFHAPQIAGINTHGELENVIDDMARSLATSMGAAAATKWRADARATVGLGG